MQVLYLNTFTLIHSFCFSLMKAKGFLLLSLFLFNSNTGKTQLYGWLTTISPGGNEYCWDVAADDFGNFFGTGRVKANSTFGATPFTTSPPMIGVETDVFLAKYRKNGQLVWAKRHGGVQPDWGRCVIADKDGNAIIAGDYCDTANFGAFHLPKIGVTLNRNIFVAKYDSSGNCLWAKHAGNSAGYSRGYAIAVDASGNIYVGGHISGIANFDGISFGITGRNIPFIAKFSSSGACLWVKHLNCSFGGEIYDLAYNKNTNMLYAAGTFRGNLIVNSITYPGTSPSWSDVFTIQVDGLGNFGWVSTATGAYQDMPYAIDIDSSNNVYIAGTFANDLKFGSTIINSFYTGTTATDANNHVNGYIAKYSSTGVFQWVETIKSDTLIWFDDITITSTGKLLAVNGYFGDAYLQDDTIYAGYDRERALIIAYDLNGNQLWYKATGTGNPLVSQCAIRGIARNAQDDIIIGGEYAGNLCYFDSFLDPSAAGWDAYLAKLYMPLDPTLNVSDTALCVGDTVVFNFTQEGSEITYTFISPPSQLNFITSANPFVAIVTGPFSFNPAVQVSNPLQVQTINFDITIAAQAYPSINVNDSIVCTGTSANFTLDTSYMYTWFDGDAASSKVVPSGAFWVTAFTDFGCALTDSFSVFNYPVSSAILSIDSATICQNDSVLVSSLPIFSAIQWYDLSTITTRYFSTAGTFTIQALDSNSCLTFDSVMVQVLIPQPFGLGNDTILCAENSFTLNAPSTHTTYTWSTGSTSTTQVFSNYSGVVWLSANDNNGCLFTDTILLSISTPIPFSLGNDTILCPETSLTLNAPLTHTSYTWSTGSTSATQTFSNFNGNVWLSANDNNGCLFTDTISLSISAPIAFSLGSDSVFCDGATIIINAPSTHSNYNWSDGSTGSTYFADTTQLIWLQAYDVNNCLHTDSILVTTDDCSSLLSYEHSTSISVFPNPFSNGINLVTDLTGLYVINMSDVSGKTIFSSQINMVAGSPVLLLNNYTIETGVYFLSIHTSASSAQQFILVKK